LRQALVDQDGDVVVRRQGSTQRRKVEGIVQGVANRGGRGGEGARRRRDPTLDESVLRPPQFGPLPAIVNRAVHKCFELGCRLRVRLRRRTRKRTAANVIVPARVSVGKRPLLGSLRIVATKQFIVR